MILLAIGHTYTNHNKPGWSEHVAELHDIELNWIEFISTKQLHEWYSYMYHHIIYINIMVKVEMGKVEVQYLYNTFPTSYKISPIRK